MYYTSSLIGLASVFIDNDNIFLYDMYDPTGMNLVKLKNIVADSLIRSVHTLNYKVYWGYSISPNVIQQNGVELQKITVLTEGWGELREDHCMRVTTNIGLWLLGMPRDQAYATINSDNPQFSTILSKIDFSVFG